MVSLFHKGCPGVEAVKLSWIRLGSLFTVGKCSISASAGRMPMPRQETWWALVVMEAQWPWLEHGRVWTHVAVAYGSRLVDKTLCFGTGSSRSSGH